MKVVGLTGGIGMGKTTAAAVFRRAHIPVFDADLAVHALQAPGGKALPRIAEEFPGSVRCAAGRLVLDRAELRRRVLADPQALRRLEAVIHPLVRRCEQAFLQRARRARARLAVLDVPLLLETASPRHLDLVIVVSAPASVQLARVRRRGLPPAQIAAMLARQMPDREKCRRADVVVHTGLSRHHAQRAIRRLIRKVLA